jgi:hypothetical protein
VLFQHYHVNSGASEQEAAHHSRGPAAHYAATRRDRFGGRIILRHRWAPVSTRIMPRIARKRLDWKRKESSKPAISP